MSFQPKLIKSIIIFDDNNNLIILPPMKNQHFEHMKKLSEQKMKSLIEFLRINDLSP
jgi:hypothetical protein